jgi:dipeptidyl aminopeptidase/acylaminoacyl peptidase
MKAITFVSFITAVPLVIMAQEIKPGENLITKNISPIPAAVAESVKSYTESRSAGALDWHPVRRELLMSTRFGNTSQIHYIKMPGGARTQLTFFEDPVGGAGFEPLKGDYFIFTRDAGGNEFAQLYRYDMSDGKITLLSDGGRSQNGGARWNRAKNMIAFTSTRRNGADRDIYTMDPRDPESTKLVYQVKGGGWGVIDWMPGDKKLILRQGLSVNESYLWLLDLADGSTKKISPVDDKGPVANGGARFTPDGKYIFFTTDKDNEFSRLARMDADGKNITYITSDIRWDIGGWDMSEDGTMIAFTANEAGFSKAYMLNTSTLKYERIKSIPDGNIGGFNWRPGKHELSYSYSPGTTNSDIYTLDVTTGKTERWTESEMGGLVASQLRAPELISWKSFDGKEISGFIYRPHAKFTGKRPVMISIHGGPEGQSTPGFQGRNNYFLNELGIAIIYPNVRGSTGYGKTFVQLDNGLLRENSVKDIGALFDWIARQPDLDASRVVVQGGSYGGYMSLAVSVHYADKIACAIDVVGISNFNTFLKNTESYRRDLRRVEYGNEQDSTMAKFLESISPLRSRR